MIRNGYGYSCNHVTAGKKSQKVMHCNTFISRCLRNIFTLILQGKGYMVTTVTVTIFSVR